MRETISRPSRASRSIIALAVDRPTRSSLATRPTVGASADATVNNARSCVQVGLLPTIAGGSSRNDVQVSSSSDPRISSSGA